MDGNCLEIILAPAFSASAALLSSPDLDTYLPTAPDVRPMHVQVSLQFFDREKRPAKGWLGGKLGAGQDDRQFWEAWVINLAVAPSTAAQHYQGNPPTGESVQPEGQLMSYPACAGLAVPPKLRAAGHGPGLASLQMPLHCGLACNHGHLHLSIHACVAQEKQACIWYDAHRSAWALAH